MRKGKNKTPVLLVMIVLFTFLFSITAEASHRSCPCKEPFTGYTYAEIRAKAQACVDCKEAVKKEHAQKASSSTKPSGSSIGLGGISHSRAAEIRRINKLRKKQLIQLQQKREAQRAKSGVNLGLKSLNALQLSPTGYKNLMNNIETVMKKDKSANLAELNGLRKKVIALYATQDKRKEMRKQKLKAENVKVQKQKAENSKKQKIDQMVDFAGRGGIPNTIQPLVDRMRAKKSLTAQDRVVIKNQRDILKEGIDRLIKSGGDKSIIAWLTRLDLDLEALQTGKQRRTEQQREKVFDTLKVTGNLDQRRKVMLDHFRSQPKPIQPDDLAKQQILRLKNDLVKIRALEDSYVVHRNRARNKESDLGYGSYTDTNKVQEMYNQMRDKEADLVEEYKVVLEKYPNNVEANFGMSEVLTYQGRKEAARDARAKALMYATPEEYRQIDSEMTERFVRSLALNNRPNPSNSRFITQMGRDFSKKYFPDTVKKEKVFDRIMKNEALQWGLFYLNEQTKPIQTWHRETQEKIKEAEKYKDPQKLIDEKTQKIPEEFLK